MKNKILSLILITAVVCSVFVISVSADSSATIEAGVYRFNDSLSIFPGIGGSREISIALPFSTPEITVQGQTISNWSFMIFLFSNGEYGLSYNVNNDFGIPFYVFADATNDNNNLYWNAAYDFSQGLLPEGYGQFITVTENTTYTDADGITFANWFADNTERVIDTAVLSAGSYEPTGDSYAPSFYEWLESGQTLWYDLRGYVITGFSTGIWFDRIGIEFLSLSDNIYRIYLYAEYQGTNLGPVFTSLFNNGVTTIEWTGAFTEAYGFYISSDTVVSEDFNNFWLLSFDSVEYVYTGNVWYDIIDSVVETLKIDVFGTFSPWDIIVTFVGLAVFLWLLKVLAGG